MGTKPVFRSFSSSLRVDFSLEKTPYLNAIRVSVQYLAQTSWQRDGNWQESDEARSVRRRETRGQRARSCMDELTVEMRVGRRGAWRGVCGSSMPGRIAT